MSDLLLKKFLINSSSKEVKTVPYDCGARLVKNEKILNYINYFKSAAEISTEPKCFEQIKQNKGFKPIDTNLVNISSSNCSIRWDQNLSSFVFKFNSKENVISVLNKSILLPLKYGKKYPWSDSCLYKVGSNYSLIKEEGAEVFDLFSVHEASGISNTHINKFIISSSPTREICFNALVEVVNNLAVFKRLLDTNYQGFSKSDLSVKNEKISSFISFAEDIINKYKFLSIGRFKTDGSNLNNKSFPFMLPCNLSFELISDNKILVKPKDIVRISKLNLFLDANSQVLDTYSKFYASSVDNTIYFSAYNALFESGKVSKELIFQQDKLVNTNLWDYLINFYIDNFSRTSDYEEVDSLLFFNPDESISELVAGYELVFKTIHSYDKKERIADRSVLFHILSDAVKRIDTDFTKELTVLNSPNKTNTSYKGILPTQVKQLDIYQRNFIYKVINLLDEKVSPTTYPLITLNAPSTTDKSSVVSTIISSNIVECCYNEEPPKVVFSFNPNNLSYENSFNGILNYELDNKRVVEHFLDQRWLTQLFQGSKVQIPYYIDLTKELAVESFLASISKDYSFHVDEYLSSYNKYVGFDLLHSDSIRLLEVFKDFGVIPHEVFNLAPSYSFKENKSLNTITHEILYHFKSIYELFVQTESSKRNFITNVFETIDQTDASVLGDIDVEILPEEENIIAARLRSLTDDTEQLAERVFILNKKIDEETLEIKRLRVNFRALTKEIESSISGIKNEMSSIVEELVSIENKSGLLVTVKGGKAKLRTKLFDKASGYKFFRFYQSALKQYVLTSDPEAKTSRTLSGNIENMVSEYKDNSKASKDVLAIEKNVSLKQESIAEYRQQIDNLTREIEEVTEHRNTVLEQHNRILRIKKSQQLLLNIEEKKKEFSDLCLGLSNSFKLFSPFVSTQLLECVDLVYKTNRVELIKQKFDSSLNYIIDNCFKSVLFSLAMRWNEGKFLEDIISLPRGYSAGSVLNRFRIMSRIFPLMLSSPQTIATSIRSLTNEGYQITYGVIDTLIVDDANRLSPEAALIGLAVSKTAIIIGDENQSGPNHVVSSLTDDLLSKKILNTGYFITPEITENVFNCHSSSLIKLAQYFTPWHPLKDLSRGDYLLSSHQTPVEIIGYLDESVYKNNLNFEFSPIYFRNSDIWFRNQLGECIIDKLSYDLVTNYKITPTKIIKDALPWNIIYTDPSYDNVSKTSNKEIISLLKWLDNNYSGLTEKYGKDISNVISIISPFKQQAQKIISSAQKIKFNNQELEQLKSVYFNPHDSNSFFIDDISHASNIKTPIVLYSNCYDESFDINTSYLFKDISVLYQAISAASNSFYLFTNRGFISKARELNKDIDSLISYIERFD